MLSTLIFLAVAAYAAGILATIAGLLRAPLGYEDREGFHRGHSPDEDLPATFRWFEPRLAPVRVSTVEHEAVLHR